MAVSEMLPESVAPLVDRILNNPLAFVPARHKDKLASTKPTHYIVLTDHVSEAFLKHQEQQVITQREDALLKQQQSQQEEMRRPKSMMEAVTAYTKKRFLTKAEKKAEKRMRQDEEDMGEAIGEDPEEDVQNPTEDSTEAVTALEAESPVQSDARAIDSGEEPFVDAVEDVLLDEDEEEEEDGDYTSDTVMAAEDEDESEESEENESEAESGENESEEANESEQEGDEVGKDQDEEDQGEDINEEAETIRVSGVPEASSRQCDLVPVAGAPLSSFYRLNENPADRGSNGSTRIYKNWRTVKGKPVGLINHGVTCYMNLAVQAMVHIPAVYHYLNDIHSGKYPNLKPRSVSHVVADLAHRMWGVEGKPVKYVNPKKLIGRLEDINCMMSEWQQEDSHEYFMSLLSRLQEDLTPSGVKLNKSIIYDIFGGLLDQTVVCKGCNGKSETQQEFYDLSLGLERRTSGRAKEGVTAAEAAKGSAKAENSGPQTNGDAGPLGVVAKQAGKGPETGGSDETKSPHRYLVEQSIKEFFSQESIRKDKKDPNSGYDCGACKQKTAALKQSKIRRAPETLAVHLKRFRFNGNSGSKVKHPVSYPSVLDLSEYSTTGEPLKYQLLSVVVHAGRSVSSGHYVVHARQPDNTWNTYDDEYLNKISEKHVLKDPAAYFLVYTRLTHRDTVVKRENEALGKEGKRKRRRTNGGA